MEVSELSKSKYKLKKVLKTSILVLLLIFIGFLIYEYIRIKPRDVRFSNISSSSVTVSWNTKTPTSATAIAFEGDTPLPIRLFCFGKEKFFDTRDVREAEIEAAQEVKTNSDDLSLTMDDFQTEITVEKLGEYYTHHVTITGLNPESTYSFMTGESLLFSELSISNSLSSATTLPISEYISDPSPAYGTIKDANNEIKQYDELVNVTDGVVYLFYLDKNTQQNSQLLSGILNSNGNWYIDLSLLKSFKETYASVGDALVAELIIDAGPLGLWRKTESAYSLAPSTLMIINAPDSIQEENSENIPIKLSTSRASTSTSLSSLNLNNQTNYSTKKSFISNFVSNSYAQAVGCDCTPQCPSSHPNSSCTRVGYDCLSTTVTCIKVNSYGTPCGGTNSKVCYSAPPDQPTCVGCSCTPSCPANYPYSSCDKENCNSNVVKCVRLNSCGTPCGGESSKTCYSAPTKDPKPACTGCSCTVSCPSDYPHSLACPSGKTCESKIEYCSRKNSCKEYCGGTESLKCFKVVSDNNINTCPTPDSQNRSPASRESNNSCKYFDKPCGKCYYISEWFPDCSPHYVECSTSNCNTGKLEEWNCNNFPQYDPEDTVCPGGSTQTPSNGSWCTYYNENCKHCQRNETAGGTYSIWKVTDIEDCGNNRTASIFECNNPIEPKPEPDPEPEPEPEPQTPSMCQCGTANGTIFKEIPPSTKWSDIDLTLCATGCSVNGEPPVFPLGNGTISWECSGTNYTKGSCRAEHQNLEYVWDQGDIINHDLIGGTFVLELDPGVRCPSINLDKEKVSHCVCKSGPDEGKIVDIDRYCRSTTRAFLTSFNTFGIPLKCAQDSVKGDVCKRDGTTCQIRSYRYVNENALYCDGDIKGLQDNINSTQPINTSSIKLVKKVSAQKSDNNLRYIVDKETGLFINLPIGVYHFEYQGDIYSVKIATQGEGYGVLLFLDQNGNNIYDENVDINLNENASLLKLTQIQSTYFYSFKKGFNFISIPFLWDNSGEPATAATLLLYLNENYNNNFYSISKYFNNWKIVGQNIELYDSNDFQLLPGEGYAIKAKEDVNIVLRGYPIQYENPTDTAPITLFKGWNLIGLYGTGVKSYTAKSLIEDINGFNDPDFTADNVSRWESDMQRYDGFQVVDENGATLEYGFDFPINLLQSYFVRVQDGSGNWQPELGQ